MQWFGRVPRSNAFALEIHNQNRSSNNNKNRKTDHIVGVKKTKTKNKKNKNRSTDLDRHRHNRQLRPSEFMQVWQPSSEMRRGFVFLVLFFSRQFLHIERRHFLSFYMFFFSLRFSFMENISILVREQSGYCDCS